MFSEEEIEKLLKTKLRLQVSATHDFQHFKRTAIGAKWFVKILGGNKRDQELAYVAGLLHDLDRPLSEKTDHANTSATKARELLCSDFDLTDRDISRVVQAIRDHRSPVEWETPLHQSVYLSDKILEQMGAYVVFRRCAFVTECSDYREFSFEEAMLHHWENRSSRFNVTAFPARFGRLVTYQYAWPAKFYEDFKKNKPYAIEISEFCFSKITSGTQSVDTLVNEFKPKEENGESFGKEARLYIIGKKFKVFERLIRN